MLFKVEGIKEKDKKRIDIIPNLYIEKGEFRKEFSKAIVVRWLGVGFSIRW